MRHFFFIPRLHGQWIFWFEFSEIFGEKYIDLRTMDQKTTMEKCIDLCSGGSWSVGTHLDWPDARIAFFELERDSKRWPKKKNLLFMAFEIVPKFGCP